MPQSITRTSLDISSSRANRKWTLEEFLGRLLWALPFNEGCSWRWRELYDPAPVVEMQIALAPHLDQWGYSV